MQVSLATTHELARRSSFQCKRGGRRAGAPARACVHVPSARPVAVVVPTHFPGHPTGACDARFARGHGQKRPVPCVCVQGASGLAASGRFTTRRCTTPKARGARGCGGPCHCQQPALGVRHRERPSNTIRSVPGNHLVRPLDLIIYNKQYYSLTCQHTLNMPRHCVGTDPDPFG